MVGRRGNDAVGGFVVFVVVIVIRVVVIIIVAIIVVLPAPLVARPRRAPVAPTIERAEDIAAAALVLGGGFGSAIITTVITIVGSFYFLNLGVGLRPRRCCCLVHLDIRDHRRASPVPL